MKTRHLLVRIAVCVTAASALGVFVGSATDSQDAPAANDNPAIGSRVDGWANRDVDIGTFAVGERRSQQEHRAGDTANSTAPTPGQQVSPEPLGAATNAGVVNPFGIGSILDGWGNQDMDIDAFGQ